MQQNEMMAVGKMSYIDEHLILIAKVFVAILFVL
jgi:hypothetical protein